MSQILIVVTTALFAAAMAVTGAILLARLQDLRDREEHRAYVDRLQPETMDIVADLDLLVRRLGAAALLGASVTGDQPDELFEQYWEGDLLRRLRRMVFGHPSPEVRAAARGVKDRMGPLLVAATDLDEDGKRPGSTPRPEQERARVVAEIDAAMVELKRATHTGVFRSLPRVATTTAPSRPSRLLRALAEKTTL